MNVLANSRCANCESRIDGPFCSQCGQREEPRVPTVRSVLGEVINALFGLESKLWRSLWALVAKPGHLTQEFLSGKRQKYTTPFRLYLLLSIMVFAFMAYTGAGININVSDSSNTQSSTERTDSQLDQSDDKQNKNKVNLNAKNMKFNSGGHLSTEREKAIEDKLKRSLEKIEDDLNSGRIDSVVNRLLEPLPKALLIFLPFVALLFKILFLGRGKYYLEHLVYLLHNHAFIFFLILISLVSQTYIKDRIPILEKPTIIFIVFSWVLYLPYYLYKSLRRVYSVSRIATVIYGFLIFLSYSIMLSIMIVFSFLFAGYNYT